MSYTTKIKEEIASIENTKSEMIAELAGFIRNNGTVTKDKIVLTTENKKTVERIKKFIKTVYNVDLKIETKDNTNFSKKELVVMNVTTNVSNILKDVGYTDSNGEILLTPPTYISPLVGFSCLYNIFISVDLPDAVAPIINTNSPFFISRSTSYKALTPFL